MLTDTLPTGDHAIQAAPATKLGTKTHCRYQQQDSTLTLREGLAEYHAANPGLFDAETLEHDQGLGGLGKFFAAHDACHVLFGLDTSLGDESLADTWTFFGTDVKWSELWSYFRSDAQKQFFTDFLGEVGYLKLTAGTLRAVPRILRTIWAARKMTQPWPLHGYKDHLDTPLDELRRDFNIRLV